MFVSLAQLCVVYIVPRAQSINWCDATRKIQKRCKTANNCCI